MSRPVSILRKPKHHRPSTVELLDRLLDADAIGSFYDHPSQLKPSHSSDTSGGGSTPGGGSALGSAPASPPGRASTRRAPKTEPLRERFRGAPLPPDHARSRARTLDFDSPIASVLEYECDTAPAELLKRSNMRTVELRPGQAGGRAGGLSWQPRTLLGPLSPHPTAAEPQRGGSGAEAAALRRAGAGASQPAARRSPCPPRVSSAGGGMGGEKGPEARREAALALVAERLPADERLFFRLACSAFRRLCPGRTRTARAALLASKARAQWARRALDVDVCARADACALAAARGDLDLLRWLRKHDAPWDASACAAAAERGHAACVRWLVRKGCAADARACEGAARAGQLALLQELRGAGCAWCAATTTAAAAAGHLDVLAWAHAGGCPVDALAAGDAAAHGGQARALAWLQQRAGCAWTADTMMAAAGAGQLEAIQYLVAQGVPFDAHAAAEAARGAHAHVLRWAHERGCALDDDVCRALASCGALELLRWARRVGVPWSAATATAAAANGHVGTLRWALDNGCDAERLTVHAAAANAHCAPHAAEPDGAPTAEGGAADGVSVALELLGCLAAHPALHARAPDVRESAEEALHGLRRTHASSGSTAAPADDDDAPSESGSPAGRERHDSGYGLRAKSKSLPTAAPSRLR